MLRRRALTKGVFGEMSTEIPPAGRDSAAAAKLQILATEHWSLLATRSLTYTESLGRVNIFLAILSGAVIALALVAQADRFGPTFISIAIFVLLVVLFTGVATIARLMHLNRDDFRWVVGMNRLRHGYLELHPELEAAFHRQPVRRPARRVADTRHRPRRRSTGRLGTARVSNAAGDAVGDRGRCRRRHRGSDRACRRRATAWRRAVGGSGVPRRRGVDGALGPTVLHPSRPEPRATLPVSKCIGARLAFFLRDPFLPWTHELGRRTPLRLLLPGTTTVSRIGHVLVTLAPLSRTARDSSLGIQARGLLSPSQRPLRWCFAASPRAFSSRLRHLSPPRVRHDRG